MAACAATARGGRLAPTPQPICRHLSGRPRDQSPPLPLHRAPRKQASRAQGRAWRAPQATATCVAPPAAAAATANPPPLPQQQQWVVRQSVAEQELKQVARLRAEAYYETKSQGRFTASFIRQFAEQEARSLAQRTGGLTPECVTLVAGGGGSTGSTGCGTGSTGGAILTVLGTLDVRPPAAASSRHPEGVPSGDPQGAYVLNLVVAEGGRGRGLGRQLASEACRMAVQRWGAVRMYCHVDADNEAALALYTRCGFAEVSSESALGSSTLQLGKRLLLCCELGQA